MRRLAPILLVAACTPLAPPDGICAPGRGPAPGASDPQTVGEGENHPVAVAVAGGTVYWLDQGPPDQAVDEGSVVALDLCTRAQRVLVRQQSRPSALALDGGFLYWVNAGRDDRSGRVCRIPRDGEGSDAQCSPVGEARPSAIAVEGGVAWLAAQGDLDGDRVFRPGTGALRRWDAPGAVTTVLDQLDAPSAIAVREGVVLFATAGKGALVDIDGKGEKVRTFAERTGAVERWRAGKREPLAANLNAPVAAILDGTRALWLERGVKRATGRLSRDDGAIAEGLDFPGALAVDGEDILVAVTGAEDEPREGHISRFRPGALEASLASHQQLPRGIAVDRHLVYWVNYGTSARTDGEVLVRWRKP